MSEIYNDLLHIVNWHPQIGDPSAMGWLTVILYFCSAILSFKVATSAPIIFSAEINVKQKCFWMIVAFILLFLGINKQLDLQSLLTAIGKFYAHRDGWYEHRRNIQIFGIISILTLALIGMGIFALKMRAILKTNWLAIVGLVFLLAFVMIRATSFHHMDILINTTVFGIRMNWVLELLGLFTIGLSALNIMRNREQSIRCA